MSDVAIRRLAPADEASVGAALAALERHVDYPLGDDRFRIDHGADYFAFFRRLGELCYLVAERDGDLVGVLAAVRRPVTAAPGLLYVCDLKSRTALGGGLLMSRLVRAALREFAADVGGVYGISMNPPGGAPNRVVAAARRFGARRGPLLHLFSLPAERMRAAAPIVCDHRGPLSYRSLRGVKDIVLRSTGAPMPLWHVQHGPYAEPGEPRPQPGGVHMFCTPAGDPLDRALAVRGFTPQATATVVCGSGDGSSAVFGDWSFVLTSDI